MLATRIVNMNAKAGRDEDYNDRYTNVHIRDVMRFKESIAAQRFATSNLQIARGVPRYKYLSLYEQSDAEQIVKEHFDLVVPTLRPRGCFRSVRHCRSSPLPPPFSCK